MTNAQAALQAAIAYYASRNSRASYSSADWRSTSDMFYQWLEEKDAKKEVAVKGSLDSRVAALEEHLL